MGQALALAMLSGFCIVAVYAALCWFVANFIAWGLEDNDEKDDDDFSDYGW